MMKAAVSHTRIGRVSMQSLQRIVPPFAGGNATATCYCRYPIEITKSPFFLSSCRSISNSRRTMMTKTTESIAGPKPPQLSVPAAAKTSAGSGKAPGSAQIPYIKDRGPVSWPSLFLVGIAAASLVAYYNIERERRLESAMGRVVSSESDGWTPNPDVMAPRKFKLTPYGWFPIDDGFGPCKRTTEKEKAKKFSRNNLPVVIYHLWLLLKIYLCCTIFKKSNVLIALFF